MRDKTTAAMILLNHGWTYEEVQNIFSEPLTKKRLELPKIPFQSGVK